MLKINLFEVQKITPATNLSTKKIPEKKIGNPSIKKRFQVVT